MSDKTAATDILSQEAMIRTCADMGEQALITQVGPYLIERQAIARKLKFYHGEHRQVFVDMINKLNVEISKIMGLTYPDTLY